MAVCDESRLAQNTDDGNLHINNVPLVCPAWEVLSLRMLWSRSVSVRGGDTVIPFKTGVRGRPRRVTANQVRLQLWFDGMVDRNGTPHGDEREGLELNLEDFEDNVADPDLGELPAVLTMPSGALRAATIIPEGITVGDGLAGLTPVVFTFTVPSGRFVDVGS